jgi:hypothetical protein
MGGTAMSGYDSEREIERALSGIIKKEISPLQVQIAALIAQVSALSAYMTHVGIAVREEELDAIKGVAQEYATASRGDAPTAEFAAQLVAQIHASILLASAKRPPAGRA